MSENGKSEFGKGLVVCLLHFANHWSDDMWQEIVALERARTGRGEIPEDSKKALDIYKSVEGLLSARITLWANGASDHLYEMETPTVPEWSIVAHKVELLKNLGLDMGHGYRNRQYTVEDIETLFRLSKEIAFEIDKLIGLSPDMGEWQ
jgi:hypothetical protein